VLLILTGIYFLYRNQFFRWVGIVAAIIGGLSGMVWVPYYPVWGSIYVAMAVLVVYALTAHGDREAAAAPQPGTPSS
jgi:membrane protein implicated in regulation of membrane protease activity